MSFHIQLKTQSTVDLLPNTCLFDPVDAPSPPPPSPSPPFAPVELEFALREHKLLFFVPMADKMDSAKARVA